MAGATTAAELFVPHLGGRGRIRPSVELERALQGVCTQSRAAWPGVEVAPEYFLPYLAERMDGSRGEQSVVDRLGTWEHVPDVYLACGCARGEPSALEAFDVRFLTDLRGVVRRLDRSGVPLDEIRQALRERLFVERGAKPLGITEYGGSGPLAAWVFVVAARVALNLLRAAKVPVEGDDSRLLALPAPDSNQELAYLKTTYGEAFSVALREAMASLPARDRTLLRQHYLDGVTLKQLAQVYGVHRVTMVHWAEDARDALRDRTHQLLLERLGITANTLHSIARLIESQFGSSLRRALAVEDAETVRLR
jgi:RNA polymerase sigma-70 factor (ECF subfamily)